jgi:hypothetical protein
MGGGRRCFWRDPGAGAHQERSGTTPATRSSAVSFN